jgi:hypothetical protein
MSDHDRTSPFGGHARETHDAFAERIAQPLRAREHLDVTFEARVMSSVHLIDRDTQRARARATDQPRGWWRRPRSIRLSPLTALAMVAGLAAIAAFGSTVMLASLGRPLPRLDAPAAQSPPATANASSALQTVRFALEDRDANAVFLVGDFNGWSKSATPLVADRDGGAWSVAVALPNGRHEYAFVVRRADGEQWVIDPVAAVVRDEFGTESSVLRLGDS